MSLPEAAPADINAKQRDGISEQRAPSTEPTAKQQRKLSNSSQFLGVPQSRPSIDTISGVSTYSIESLTTIRSREAPPPPQPDSSSRDGGQALEPEDTSWKGRIKRNLDRIWEDQKGVLLMLLAQFFASTMATTARFMETMGDDEVPMSPFQLLLVRMTVTMAASLAYMYIAKVPDAPFGARNVRWLLVLRGFCGFFGVIGLYFSLIYLPLAEATVITFMAPLLAAWLSSVFLETPFTRMHKISALISVAGVILIAQPFNFFPADASDPSPSPRAANATAAAAAADSHSHPEATPSQRAIAVCVALLGVCGASGAYTSILKIGKRAHPLISVNYFATWCTLISLAAVLFAPGVPFRLPNSAREWALMAFLGVSGFIMQFLLTASLSVERQGSKGLNMVYTQMLFAVAMDKLVFGTMPTWVGILGSSLILGSAIWVAVHKESDGPAAAAEGPEGQAQPASEEEVGLVGAGRESRELEPEQGYVAESHVVGDADDDDGDDQNEHARLR